MKKQIKRAGLFLKFLTISWLAAVVTGIPAMATTLNSDVANLTQTVYGQAISQAEYTQIKKEYESEIETLKNKIDVLERENEVLKSENEEFSRYDEFTEAEWVMLYRIARSEAGSWSAEGQKNVVKVILNRVASDRFPDTIEEVIMQKGQFEAESNGSYYKVEITDFTIENVKQGYLEWCEGNNADDALFFCAGWLDFNRHFLFQDEVGHKFYS